MEINMTGEDIQKGVKRGLQLIDSDLSVPISWHEDLLALKYLLKALDVGSYRLVPNKEGQKVPEGMQAVAVPQPNGEGSDVQIPS